MNYPCSENKGADQLCGYREADLRLCFRICKKPVFSRRGSYIYIYMPRHVPTTYLNHFASNHTILKLEQCLFFHSKTFKAVQSQTNLEPITLLSTVANLIKSNVCLIAYHCPFLLFLSQESETDIFVPVVYAVKKLEW